MVELRLQRFSDLRFDINSSKTPISIYTDITTALARVAGASDFRFNLRRLSSGRIGARCTERVRL